MSDPLVRLIEETATPQAERQLLEAGADVSPPPGAKTQVWAALAAQLPPAVPPGAETAIGSAAKAGLWKAVGIGFACGLLVAGGSFVIDPVRAPQADAVSPPPEVAPQNAPVTTATEPALTQPEAPAAETSPTPAAPRAQRAAVSKPNALTAPATAPEPGESEASPAEPSTARESQLADESRRLREARAALRAGNGAQALSLLEKSRTEHPVMVLGQEHEALVIESLAASGSRLAAKQRARAFISRYPTSPHADKLRVIAETP